MKRIEVLDVWRSLAILLMMAYHLIYDLYMFDVISYETLSSAWAYSLRYLAVGSFLVISGAVVRFSRDSIRRGVIVFACGIGVTVVMRVAVGEDVQFGVLHLLGTMMIAYGLISEKVKAPKGIWFPLLLIVLFAVTYHICYTTWIDARWLYPIGLRYKGFVSADYYPLLPWGLLFGIGVWLGGLIDRHRDLPILNLPCHRVLTFLGRHSLIVYLAHQPIIYGICFLLFGRK